MKVHNTQIPDFSICSISIEADKSRMLIMVQRNSQTCALASATRISNLQMETFKVKDGAKNGKIIPK